MRRTDDGPHGTPGRLARPGVRARRWRVTCCPRRRPSPWSRSSDRSPPPRTPRTTRAGRTCRTPRRTSPPPPPRSTRSTASSRSSRARSPQTQAAAVKRGEELEVAAGQTRRRDHQGRSDPERRPTRARAKADAASAQAGKLAAQLYRTGGRNLTANLFLSGNGASTTSPDKLLSDLGSMSKLVEQSEQGLRRRQGARRTRRRRSPTQADGGQGRAREAARRRRRPRMQAAVAAAKAAQDKLAEQQKQIVVMQAQLAALTRQDRQDGRRLPGGRRRGGAPRGRRRLGRPPRRVRRPAGLGRSRRRPDHRRLRRRAPRPGGVGSTYHLGIDIGAYCNAPIYAAARGNRRSTRARTAPTATSS